MFIFFIRLVRDPQAGYEQSLNVLRYAKTVRPHLVTKSSIMLGIGETEDEVFQTLKGRGKLADLCNTLILI